MIGDNTEVAAAIGKKIIQLVDSMSFSDDKFVDESVKNVIGTRNIEIGGAHLRTYRSGEVAFSKATSEKTLEHEYPERFQGKFMLVGLDVYDESGVQDGVAVYLAGPGSIVLYRYFSAAEFGPSGLPSSFRWVWDPTQTNTYWEVDGVPTPVISSDIDLYEVIGEATDFSNVGNYNTSYSKVWDGDYLGYTERYEWKVATSTTDIVPSAGFQNTVTDSIIGASFAVPAFAAPYTAIINTDRIDATIAYDEDRFVVNSRNWYIDDKEHIYALTHTSDDYDRVFEFSATTFIEANYTLNIGGDGNVASVTYTEPQTFLPFYAPGILEFTGGVYLSKAPQTASVRTRTKSLTVVFNGTEYSIATNFTGLNNEEDYGVQWLSYYIDPKTEEPFGLGTTIKYDVGPTGSLVSKTLTLWYFANGKSGSKSFDVVDGKPMFRPDDGLYTDGTFRVLYIL